MRPRAAQVTIALVFGLLCAHWSRAAETVVLVPGPEYDVWMYPPGAGELSNFAAIFGSPLNAVEPDRMSYMSVVFRTSLDIDPAGGPYEVVSARLGVFVLNSSSFDSTDGTQYDPTYDSYRTYPPLGDLTDIDPGRPIELYGSQLQPGVIDFQDWINMGAPVLVGGGYASEPMDFDALGVSRVVINNADDLFDTNPWAIGQTIDTYVASDSTVRIADGAEITFDINISDPNIQAYLASGLQAGWIGLNVTSLHQATSPVTGQGLGQIYPRLANQRTFLFPDPYLELTIRPATLACSPADITTTNTNPGDPGFGIPDGTANGADLSFYVELWFTANTAADLTTTNTNPGDTGFGVPDGFVNGADISFYVELWLQGCV